MSRDWMCRALAVTNSSATLLFYQLEWGFMPQQHRRPPINIPPPQTAADRKGAGLGWAVIGIVVVGAIVLTNHNSSGGSGSDGNTASTPEAAQAQLAIGTAIAAQASPAVKPLDGPAVRKGFMHLRLASGEGLAGEMVYSQNCYDELGRTFAWARLDTCGAFDAKAAVTLGDDEPVGENKEGAWFQSEAVAGRYLKAAVAAGENAEEADRRLAGLQARAARGHHSAGSSIAPLLDGNEAAPALVGGNTA